MNEYKEQGEDRTESDQEYTNRDRIFDNLFGITWNSAKSFTQLYLNKNSKIGSLAETNYMTCFPNVLMKVIKQIDITIAYAEHSHNPQLSASGHR